MGPFIDLLSSAFIGLMFAFFLFVLFPVGLVYVALRVRDSRAAIPDPKLGAKLAFHLLHSLAILMILIGLSVSASDLMQGLFGGNKRNAVAQLGRPQQAPAAAPDEFWNGAQRSAAALVGTGALFTFAFWVLLTGTNDRKFPAVRRTFVGGRLAVCLLLLFFSVAALVLLVVQKEAQIGAVEMLTGVIAVWLPASTIHLFLLHRAMQRPLEPAPKIAHDRDDA